MIINDLKYLKTRIYLDDLRTIHYYADGMVHKIDSPAIIRYNGYKGWIINNMYYRKNKPAIICHNGNKYWCTKDQLIKITKYG